MGDSSHVIGQALVDAATVAYRTYLEEFFISKSDGIADIFAETIPANGAKSQTLIVEDYLGTWLEFVGARQTTSSRAYSQTITLSTWAQQIQIRRTDMTYDMIGNVAARLRKFLSGQQSYKEQLIFDKLVSNSGNGPTGYDGVAMIGTTHPNGPSGNQSNKGTTALSQISFDTAFATMTGLKRENGEPFRVQPKYLVHGPTLNQTALQITKGDIRAAGLSSASLEGGTTVAAATTANMYRGVVEPVMWPRLTGTQAAYWYLIGEGPGAAKPMVFVEGMPPTEQIDDQLGSPTVMATDRCTYGLIADGQAAAGAWQCLFAGVL